MTTTEIATVQAMPTPSVNILMDSNAFCQLQRVATMFSASQLVPAHLRGKVADCAIALYMAHRLNEDPLTIMQNIVIVNGRAGWMTQYMIGRANMSGVFKGRIRWRTELNKGNLTVTAFAQMSDTGEEVTAMADMAMAKAEGWTKNAKYQSMPEHMLKWRSAAMLVRLYCPEVMLGIPSEVELQHGQVIDIEAIERTKDSLPPEEERDSQKPMDSAGWNEAVDDLIAGLQTAKTQTDLDLYLSDVSDQLRLLGKSGDAAAALRWAEAVLKLRERFDANQSYGEEENENV